MATLLQTNSRFVEAYLVGLNHEMARELLWRGYPTDQRGTCFASFWTGADELVADLHQAAWRHGALGSHVRPELDGQIVFMVRGDLVRRYPGVVAHAVLEHSVDAEGLPRGWIRRMKHAMHTLGWRFNADRMVMDYAREAYLSAAGGRSAAMPRRV